MGPLKDMSKYVCIWPGWPDEFVKRSPKK
jgi:hypothetical protein